jgi:hypothetical protein
MPVSSESFNKAICGYRNVPACSVNYKNTAVKFKKIKFVLVKYFHSNQEINFLQLVEPLVAAKSNRSIKATSNVL